MKLNWCMRDNKCWEADFGNGLLTLKIDFADDTIGIYDPDPVWEAFIGAIPHAQWTDLAMRVESELAYRLSRMAETLNASWLESPHPPSCDVCGLHTKDTHTGFYQGDQERCPSCLAAFTQIVTDQAKAKAADKLVGKFYNELSTEFGKQLDAPTDIYWVERPFFTVTWKDKTPSTQVAESIQAEAKTVKL